MEADKEKIEYITKSKLIDNGWTDGLINKVLGEPDKLAKNPHYSSQAKVRLFDIRRVEEFQKTEEWIKHLEKTNARRAKIKDAQRAKIQAILDRNKPLVDLGWQNGFMEPCQTRDWVDFEWEHFEVIEDIIWSHKKKAYAVEIVRNMLAKSYWIPVKTFLEVFELWGKDFANSDEIITTLANSIEQKGWQGIPFVTMFWGELKIPIKLDSGYHRFKALQLLLNQGKITPDFKVPVFNIFLLHGCVPTRKYYMSKDYVKWLSEIAKIYRGFYPGNPTIKPDRETALAIIANDDLMSLVTGINCL